MALKVIGTGFGRTGTLSAYTALNQLGFPCYHMFEVIENKDNKSHLDFWVKVANTPAGTKHDWDAVFAKYTAAVDNPACCVWRELMLAYPDAKVLLTLHPRGPEAWYESTIGTIYFTENRWQAKLLSYFAPFVRKMSDMSHKHIEDVKAEVPPEKLLIFKADQGWKPLCDFLGVPIPAQPFPNVNDRAQIKKVIAGMTMGAYVILALGAATLAGLIYGITRFVG